MFGTRVTSVGFLITAISWCGSAAVYAGPAPEPLHLAVTVCDFEHVPPTTMAVAKRIADDAYRTIGVTIDWIEAGCDAGAPGLHVNIVSRETAGFAVAAWTLGFAEPGSSAATVLYDRVLCLGVKFHIRRDVLLGYTMAHELGHLLLPAHSHSDSGVMRASLDLQRAAEKKLCFTSEQAQIILARLNGASPVTSTN